MKNVRMHALIKKSITIATYTTQSIIIFLSLIVVKYLPPSVYTNGLVVWMKGGGGGQGDNRMK